MRLPFVPLRGANGPLRGAKGPLRAAKDPLISRTPTNQSVCMHDWVQAGFVRYRVAVVWISQHGVSDAHVFMWLCGLAL